MIKIRKKHPNRTLFLTFLLCLSLIIGLFAYRVGTGICVTEMSAGEPTMLSREYTLGTIVDRNDEFIVSGDEKAGGVMWRSPETMTAFKDLLGLDFEETMESRTSILINAPWVFGAEDNRFSLYSLLHPQNKRIGGDARITIDRDLQEYISSYILKKDYNTDDVYAVAQMYANGAEQAVFEKTDMDADKGAGNTGDDQTEDGQTDKGENGSGENGFDQDSTQMDLIPVKLNMVCSRNYGIGAFVHADKIMVCNVIFRNEAVPTVRETHSFVTSKDGMSECDFPIYESTGNERYVELSEAEKIGMCTLKIKGNLPKGTPLFVRVEAGIDGVLHFTGREESGNTEITAEFKTKTLLTEEELETAKQVVDDVYAKVV